jgi:ADP-ribosyl-[dinitrogen reductase] hydrolase
MPSDLREAITGCILGTALGDSIGLPAEGLSRRRQRRMFPALSGHQFLLGRGMVSDDTEHTCLVAAALVSSGGDVDVFRRRLAAGLRWWLLGLPAGVGFATLRATILLWLGVPPDRSGVFSAGNGPAMRSALLGVCCGGQPDRLRALVRASTRLTHTDPKAEWAAFTVALAASHAHFGSADPDRFQAALEAALGGEAVEFLALTNSVVASVGRGETTEQFADSIGLYRGVSGYCFHSVPVALHAWLSHPNDYCSAVLAVIRCGGDTDTTGAITGAITGSGVGSGGLPEDWISGLAEWPRTIGWMRTLSAVLAAVVESGRGQPPPTVPFGSVLLRNVFFVVIVIGHGVRRLLPPY